MSANSEISIAVGTSFDGTIVLIIEGQQYLLEADQARRLVERLNESLDYLRKHPPFKASEASPLLG